MRKLKFIDLFAGCGGLREGKEIKETKFHLLRSTTILKIAEAFNSKLRVSLNYSGQFQIFKLNRI
jgi:hypothetical protein